MSATAGQHRIEVVVHGASNAIGSHDYPMLESGNLAFPNGKYAIDFQPAENGPGFNITHYVEGAPLIPRLVKEGVATYACIVSSPLSSYRKIHQSSEVCHPVSWNFDDIAEPPLFTPLVVCVRPLELSLNATRDGVHEIWHGQKINLDTGSRIAVGNVVQLSTSVVQLLSLRSDENLRPGQFVADMKSEPFGFRVDLHPDLHRFLRHSTDSTARNNVMVHIVTACLSILQRECSKDDGDSGWKSSRNLQALSEYIKSKDLPDWTDDEFKPEKVATAIYPLSLPAGVSSDEMEDVP